MMKIKTVKGKIAAGVVAASVLSTSAFAFANTNAGTQFTAWGEAQITAALNAIGQKAGTDRTAAQNQISTDAAADQNTAKGKIDAAGTAEKAETKTNIEAKLGEHLASLKDAFDAFTASIGGRFDAKVNAENGTTTNALNTQYSQLSASITNALNAAKASNVESVTEESLLVKGKATSDLIKAINKAKSDLAASIETEEATANTEVAAHLTSEVDRINGQLDTLIGTLETSAKTAIQNAGNSVEASAIANFERVISRTQVETPIEVDKQKIEWTKSSPMTNGKVQFTVKNSNEFDVVFRYKFVSVGKEAGGVSETTFAESSVTPGTNVMNFDVNKFKTIFGKFDQPGVLVIEYLNENGQFEYGAEVGAW
jgi:hypothetical protein